MKADFANMQHVSKFNKFVSFHCILLTYTEKLHGWFVLKRNKGKNLTKVLQKEVQKPGGELHKFMDKNLKGNGIELYLTHNVC